MPDKHPVKKEKLILVLSRVCYHNVTLVTKFDNRFTYKCIASRTGTFILCALNNEQQSQKPLSWTSTSFTTLCFCTHKTACLKKLKNCEVATLKERTLIFRCLIEKILTLMKTSITEACVLMILMIFTTLTEQHYYMATFFCILFFIITCIYIYIYTHAYIYIRTHIYIYIYIYILYIYRKSVFP